MKKLVNGLFSVTAGLAVILAGATTPVSAIGAENPAFEYGEEELAIRRNYEFYDEGELVSSQTIINGECLHEPEAKGKEGYVFAGWFYGDEEISFWTAIDDIEVDAETYRVDAKYVEAEIVAQFVVEDENGALVRTSKQADENGKVTLDVEFGVALNKYIKSWTDEDGNEFMNGSTVALDKTTIFTANVADKLVVTFDTDAEDVFVNPEYVVPAQTAPKPTDPERAGYTFVRWTKDGEAYDFSMPVNEDITLKAEWEALDVNYTIVIMREKFNSANEEEKYEAIQVIDNRTAKAGETVSIDGDDQGIDFPNMQFYKFVEADQDVEVKGDGTTIVYAYFDLKTYTFVFEFGENSDQAPSQRSLTVGDKTCTQGEACEIEVKFGDDLTGIWPATVTNAYNTMDIPVIGTVNIPQTLRRWAGPNNIRANLSRTFVGLDMLPEDGDEETKITWEARYDQGRATGNGRINNGEAIDEDEYTVEPGEPAYYNVSIDPDNGDNVLEDEYEYGSELDLEEPEKDGYTFIGWFDNLSGKIFDPNTMVVTSDLELVAKYIEDDEVVLICYNDPNGGSVVDPYAYVLGGGAQAILSGFEGSYQNDGDTFVGWSLFPATYYAHDSASELFHENDLLAIDDFMNYIVDGVLNLFAAFDYKSPVVQIIYYANNGEDSLTTQELARNEDYTVLSNPFTKEGYLFMGWNTMPDGSGAWYFPGDIIAPLSYWDSYNDLVSFNELYAIYEEIPEEEEEEPVVEVVSTEVENPYTVDDINNFVILAIVAVAGLGISLVALRKDSKEA